MQGEQEVAKLIEEWALVAMIREILVAKETISLPVYRDSLQILIFLVQHIKIYNVFNIIQG
jgi:hypothetical protein